MGEFFFRVCTLGGAAGHEERKRLKKLKSANTRVQNNDFGRREWGDGVTKLTYRILVEVRRHLTFLVTFLHLV